MTDEQSPACSGGLWLPQGGVEDRPEVNDPTQQEKPEGSGQEEHDDGLEKPALQQLAKPGDEKAAKRSDDVPGRSLARHMLSYVSVSAHDGNESRQSLIIGRQSARRS